MANLQQKHVLDVVTTAVDLGDRGLFSLTDLEERGRLLSKTFSSLMFCRLAILLSLSPHLALHLSFSTAGELRIHDSRFPWTFNKIVFATYKPRHRWLISSVARN